MKTREQILEILAAGKKSECLDGRDFYRLADFFPVADWPKLGLSLKDDVDVSKIPPPKELTRENVLEQLAKDLDFGFEKALNRRGISAGLMFEVVKLWMWVLDDDELANYGDDNYAQYGLPLFKAVAVKYDLPNPIGDDTGTEEDKYSAEAPW